MKYILTLLILVLIGPPLFANHIKGGWIYYEYLGTTGSGNLQYKVTLKVYRDCNPPNPGQNDPVINIAVYNGASTQAQIFAAPMVNQYTLQKTTFNPCMSNPPSVCYVILHYETTIELAPSSAPYTLSFQRCCRIGGINNVTPPSNRVGNTYSITIPGTANSQTFPQNNSPVFAEKDTAIVCYNQPFTLDYSATDIDGDSLVYYYSPALDGGSSGNPTPSISAPPPYNTISYPSGYTYSNPFGTNATINSKTGLISGKAPSATGEYVISVSVDEYRQGRFLATTRKELHVVVGNCTLAAAQLDPTYVNCDSLSFTFENNSSSPAIHSYLWDFGVPGITTDTSTLARPTYVYTDTGTYTVKLVVNRGEACADSTTTTVKTYPGFVPDFSVVGSCYQVPYKFTDKTTTKYGTVNYWSWDFGDPQSNADTSHLKNPTYQYSSISVNRVLLTVGSDKGCIDTISKLLDVRDKPIMDIPFRDTLICSIDTLQLRANGPGVFSWTPNQYIINANTSTPLVFPKDTTTYIVTMNDNGCINTDSIKVNVLDFITVTLPPDTTICKTDSFRLSPVSYALQYHWTPSTGLSSTSAKSPMAAPLTDIVYNVQANLGKCEDKTSIRVKVVPYPQAVATGDTTICYGSSTQLRAQIVASSFTWSPTNSLLRPTTLTPVAGPQTSTTYILTVYDTLGCPKPFRDSVKVVVIPPVKAFAGNDTSVVVGQPLQLHATGGTNYLWSPGIGLSTRTTADPILILDSNIDSLILTVRASTPEGCYADDKMTVKVFRTGPQIFVPSGFTPNGDGRNDIMRPILVGMKKLEYFRIYNRWGEVVYETSEIGKGWDGIYAGKEQPSGTYVYVAKAIDYKDNPAQVKGSIVLIR